MEWSDLPREMFLENPNTQEVIEEWDEKFGGYERVLNEVLPKIYSDYHFEWNFPGRSFLINRTVYCYFIIEHILSQGALDKKNIAGKVLDIASFLGASVDALSAFGGIVKGTDDGRHAYSSIGNRYVGIMNIGVLDGKGALRDYYYEKNLDLVSFFNIECDSGKGSISDWCNYAFPALKDDGQILITTYLNSYMVEELKTISGAHIIKLPERLSERETYAFTARKPKTKI